MLCLSLKQTQFYYQYDQCDQIGRFFKVLGDKYLSKVAQMFGDFWGILKT